ncbi:hypothetical protein FRZ06_02340 [Anoxybacterium hadale]|uniref:Uncharacterized protein n=1 Tax=Anoxybacterium hadale TaxID=3408580 RepID=A0ACD1A7A9_9FIRM|nr:hypothetical protein FRZ06_02340 [Clostridiales bacterium]
MTHEFLCPGREESSLSRGAAALGAEVFSEPSVLLEGAVRNQKEYKSAFLRLPPGFPAELTDFGQKFRIDGGMAVPGKMPFQKPEALAEFLRKNQSLRIGKIVLESLKRSKLTTVHSPVILSFYAPFSLAAALTDSFLLYRMMNHSSESVALLHEILSRITVLLSDYAIDGLACGADILSLADPYGNLELVGGKCYREFSGKYSAMLLKRLEPELGAALVHLCGKTALSLEKTGFMRATESREEPPAPYARILIKSLRKEPSFLGYGCIHCEESLNDRFWVMHLS